MSQYCEDFYLKKLFEKAKVKDVMSVPKVTAHIDDPLLKIHEIFITHHVSHLLVVDRHEELAGIISPKYLYKARSPQAILYGTVLSSGNDLLMVDNNNYYTSKELSGFSLTSVMQRDPFTLSKEHTLGEAVTHMHKKNIDCIPVVCKKKVEGMLTHKEIINFTVAILNE